MPWQPLSRSLLSQPRLTLIYNPTLLFSFIHASSHLTLSEKKKMVAGGKRIKRETKYERSVYPLVFDPENLERK